MYSDLGFIHTQQGVGRLSRLLLTSAPTLYRLLSGTRACHRVWRQTGHRSTGMDKQQPNCSLCVLLIDLPDKALLESLQENLHYACNLLALSKSRPAASHVALCSLAKDPGSSKLQLQVLAVPCSPTVHFYLLDTCLT